MFNVMGGEVRGVSYVQSDEGEGVSPIQEDGRRCEGRQPCSR